MDKLSISQNKAVLTSNLSILIGYLFVFQISELDTGVRICLITSFTLYLFSLIMLIWHVLRYPKREKLFEQLKERTVGKHSERMNSLIEELILPLARYKIREKTQKLLAQAKNKKEKTLIIEKEIEDIKSEARNKFDDPNNPERKAIGYAIEGMLHHMTEDSHEDYRKAFKSPLDERGARLKFNIDRLALKLKIYLFVAGTSFAIIAVFIKLLSTS